MYKKTIKNNIYLDVENQKFKSTFYKKVDLHIFIILTILKLMKKDQKSFVPKTKTENNVLLKNYCYQKI